MADVSWRQTDVTEFQDSNVASLLVSSRMEKEAQKNGEEKMEMEMATAKSRI